MKEWEKFENEVKQYLDEALRKYDLVIKQLGKSDSTISDISIKRKTGEEFFVETKMANAQTSQFVVEIEKEIFIYSSKNKHKPNNFSDSIMDVLNSNFTFYKNVTQESMIVPIPDEIAFGWIISNMKNKDVGLLFLLIVKAIKKLFLYQRLKISLMLKQF